MIKLGEYIRVLDTAPYHSGLTGRANFVDSVSVAFVDVVHTNITNWTEHKYCELISHGEHKKAAFFHRLERIAK